MIDIIQNPYLVKSETVQRSWKERLFTWPWKPWRRTKILQVPSNEAIVDAINHKVYVHPEFYETLKKSLPINPMVSPCHYVLYT